MKNTKFKLAMGQMAVFGGEVGRNLKKACFMIEEAASKKCKIIVLPECLDIGWTDPKAKKLAKPIPGIFSDKICKCAKKNNIYVVAGLTERFKDKIYNSAILVSPEGKILLKHRKINELDIAHGLYSIGDSLSVADTPLGIIGVNICADNFGSSLVLGHSLARMGAQIILSPSAWAVKKGPVDKKGHADFWERSYRSLAKLYDMTVVGVSNVGPISGGPWKGRICIGSSLAVGPKGNILARGPYGEYAEELMVIDVKMVQRKAKGTEFSGYLKKKGYKGI